MMKKGEVRCLILASNYRTALEQALTPLDCTTHVSILENASISILNIHWVANCIVHMNLAVVKNRPTLF